MSSSRTVILIAEDDPGHASLIERNLRRAGIHNLIRVFPDGQTVLDFLFERQPADARQPHTSYILLLDVRMPGVDGLEVLRRIKQDPEVKKMPVIMMTTTDDPREVEACHRLGCNLYVTKPIEYDKFVDVVQKLGLVLATLQVPAINGVG